MDMTKKHFYEGCLWLKSNNLRLALQMALRFYISAANRLKLKVRKFWALIPNSYVCRSFREKKWLGPTHLILNMVKRKIDQKLEKINLLNYDPLNVT